MENKTTPIRLLELTFSELVSELKSRYGKGAYHAAAIFREVYINGNINPGKAPEFINSKAIYHQLHKDLQINVNTVSAIKKENGLTKFVTKLKDGLEIESVIIPMATHYTVCVSSQVGCKMGCKFCETAILGFFRNLSVEEIIGQVYTAKFVFGADVRNVVFMGMGEPLDNFDNVVQAIRVMEDQRGLDIPKRYISVSTAGLVPGIQKLADLNWPQLNLAVSLNAPNDEIRSKIMPINKIYSMNNLRKMLVNFPRKKNGAVYIEYVLIKRVNDRREHAMQLADYLKPLKAKFNLIPYNCRTDSLFLTPSEDDVSRFLNWLVENEIFVRKRSVKGRNIMAGCGQLGNKHHISSHRLLPEHQPERFNHFDRVI
ncbi:MAG: 23S rRNA (adenine(2503)-C(2))-methyltransferase RlmN [Desulfobacterales bacterium]